MFLADKINDAFCLAFQADPHMTALCPGGIWHRFGLPAERGGILPYATVAVVPLPDKEYFTDRSCIQSFVITVRFYAEQTAATVGEIANYLSDWDLDIDFWRNVLVADVLGFVPQGEALDVDAQKKEGLDVVVAEKTWTLRLHYL